MAKSQVRSPLQANAVVQTLKPKLSVLGTFFDGLPDHNVNGITFGANVATQTFLEAMLQHGRMNEYELFARPGREQSAQDQVTRVIHFSEHTPKTIHVSPYRDLLDDFDNFRFSVWHDPGGFFHTMYHLRSARAQTLYPVTFTHHSLSYPEMLYEFYLRLLLSDTYPCDSVVCTTPSARTVFQNLMEHVAESFNRAHGANLRYRGRYDYIPLGVDTDLFRPRDKADLRYQLTLPKDALIILWLGRFSVADKMDLQPLVRTFRELVDANPQRKLLLLMAGSERDGYGTFLKEYGDSLGLSQQMLVLLNFPTRARHLLHAAADIFVSPVDNIQETFGLTPIEAMACGVPQVVADWDGYRDTVRHEETGFRVPTYWAQCDRDLHDTGLLEPWEIHHLRLAESVVVDMNAYREALQTLIENPALRQQMGRASRERAVSLYSWNAVIGEYEALWAELGEIAPTLPAGPSPVAAYAQLPYFDAFRHYATALIPEQALLRLTPEGLRALRGKDKPRAFPGQTECINEQLINQLLIALRVAGRFGRGYAFDQLAQDITTQENWPLDYARRHVLWLLKYRYVEIEGGFPSPEGRKGDPA